MDTIVIGIDVSKDRLDVSVQPAGTALKYSRDAAGIALAAFGFLNPLLAAFIHVTSELAFILNSTRLLPPPQHK
jgi:cation transport ATPase